MMWADRRAGIVNNRREGQFLEERMENSISCVFLCVFCKAEEDLRSNQIIIGCGQRGKICNTCKLEKSVFVSFFSPRGIQLYWHSSQRGHFSMCSCVLAVGVLSTITRKFKCVIFLEGNRRGYLVLECTILIFSVVC